MVLAGLTAFSVPAFAQCAPGIGLDISGVFNGTSTDAAIARAGDVINYTVTVNLTGSQCPINNGSVTLTLPDTTVVSLSTTLSLSPGASMAFPGNLYTVATADIGKNGAPAGHIRALAGVTAIADRGGGITQDVAATTNFDTLIISPHTTLTKTASPTGGPAPLAVTYTYHETNDGDSNITGVTLTDDTCSPVVRGPDSPGNNDSTLAPGETWVFTCTHTFTTGGTFTNIVVAAGTAADQRPAPEERATATVTVTTVHTTLTKTASPTSGVAPLTVTYSYNETNDGTEPLSGVALTDDTCSPVTRGPDSPGNNDATLAPGETWTFTCTHTFTTGGTFTNTATATGNTSAGAPAPAETASATVTVTQVHTTLTKTASPTSGVAPLTVTYTYNETNDGTEPLTGVTLTDDMCSPVTRGPDSPGNNDATLAPGETWTFTCSHTFTTAGTFTNTATATGIMSNDQAAPNETAQATVTVTPAVQALTPGYWKNHEAATTALLPQTLGSFTVSDFATATAVFDAMNCSNSGKSTQNAVGCLAGHLLAAKLNVANGASSCIAPTITAADAFLVSIGYTGPAGTYTLTAAQRATAISLKSTLDSYNNTGVCA
jgi:uncharacterized repeat protein (TIGR01451 family)